MAILDGEDGAFPDLDSFVMWMVEGGKSILRSQSGPSFQTPGNIDIRGSNPPSKVRLKLQPFSHTVGSSSAAGSSSVAQRGRFNFIALDKFTSKSVYSYAQARVGPLD